MKMEIREIGEKLSQSEKILVGLGEEWQMKPDGGDLQGCRLGRPRTERAQRGLCEPGPPACGKGLLYSHHSHGRSCVGGGP